MKYWFPSYLSMPYQILFFEPDDMIMLGVGFWFGILLGGWFWLLLILAPYLYIKAKRRNPRGFMKHRLYGLGLVNLKYYPDAFTKEFQE